MYPTKILTKFTVHSSITFTGGCLLCVRLHYFSTVNWIHFREILHIRYSIVCALRNNYFVYEQSFFVVLFALWPHSLSPSLALSRSPFFVPSSLNSPLSRAQFMRNEIKICNFSQAPTHWRQVCNAYALHQWRKNWGNQNERSTKTQQETWHYHNKGPRQTATIVNREMIECGIDNGSIKEAHCESFL